MSAHTPGPWSVYNGGDIFSALGSDSGDGVMAADNDGWHIAEIPQRTTTTEYGDEVELGWEVMRANARLIAAAPELLEACQLALAFVATWAGVYQHDHGLPDFHPRHKEAIEQVKSAIAKATGGAA